MAIWWGNDPDKLAEMEERGELYYQYQPGDYPPVRGTDESDRLRSGIREVGNPESTTDSQ